MTEIAKPSDQHICRKFMRTIGLKSVIGKFNKLPLFLILIFSFAAVACVEEKIILKGPAPPGLLHLSHKIPLTDESILNKGSHGLEQYCYKCDSYIVQSKNYLGEGYELSSKNPPDLKCNKTDNPTLKVKNLLGMHIDMPKRIVFDLLEIESEAQNLIIIWQSKTEIKGIVFDVQTHVEIQFIHDKLSRLSVFTTTTN